MTTLFSNATQDFIEFGRVSHLAKNGNQTAIAEVAVAAARFKSNASSNALYLVYIGKIHQWYWLWKLIGD